MKSKSLFVFLFVTGLVVAVPFFWMRNEIRDKQEIHQSWDRYLVANRQSNTMPVNPVVINIRIDKDTATLALQANPPNLPSITGTAVVLHENSVWKVESVHWDADVSALVASKPVAPPEQPAPAALLTQKTPTIARVVLNNDEATFELAIDAQAETRFDNPAAAVLEFRQKNEAQSLVLHFNASQTGFQITDGEKIQLRYKRNDQTYLPAAACLLQVSSAYTGDNDSRLTVSIKDCDLFAGEMTYKLLMEFTINGPLVATSDPKQ